MFLRKIMEYLTSYLFMYNCSFRFKLYLLSTMAHKHIHSFNNYFSISKLKSQSRKKENCYLKIFLETLVHMENLWSWKGSAGITKYRAWSMEQTGCIFNIIGKMCPVLV